MAVKTVPLTAEQCYARFHAYEEAAGHLELDWTDNPIEREQAKKIASLLRRSGKKWRREGYFLEDDEPLRNRG